MKFSITAIIVAVASTVYAQTTVANAGVAVNLPGYGVVITAGTPYTITWTVDTASTNPSTTINSIALMKGSSGNLETAISNILSAAIPVSPASYSWNVPTTVETGAAYALALAGSNGATTYSTYFTIIGAAPGTSNATVSSSGAAVVPAASSGAASSGAASSGAASASASASSSSSTNAASGIKAGLMGVAGVAVGAVALLL